MSLLSAAAIEVGKAIAKSIFKVWVKDSALGDDISSNLIDLLGSKTSDILAQRKGNRQFEEIGDKISESIQPLLESEGVDVDTSERRAIAIAVATTLNTSKLSSNLLLEHNLQPTGLERYMLAAHPDAARDFSEVGAALYLRLIKECCTYIIDISSQLPSFTEYSFAEVLKREDLIIAKVDEALKELQKIREQLNPLIEAERFEIEYRDAVARNLDVLHLIGADVALVNRRHKLSVAYITLSVEQNSSLLSDDTSTLPTYEHNEPLQDIVPVDVALASAIHLLIRGQAGTGKTTLLQWIAVQAATKSFSGCLADWNGIIPFYIRLRHYTQSRLPKPEAFLDFVAPSIAGMMPERWVHKALRSGRAIVLVDGVDEVSSAQREEVHTWLKDLVKTYQTVRFIVTSRPHAIEEGWMNNEAFNDAELQPMKLPDIYSFIDHWRKAVQEELHNEDEKKELVPLSDHLKEQVRLKRAIHNLATNPLLCAMLCALNRDRKRQLPVRRTELYSACCSLLLERRDKESHVDLIDYPALDYGQKQRLLQDLAYWMIRENISEAAKSLVDERFANQLANMPGMSRNITGAQVRRLFVERSGIVREPVGDQIDFAHRTFQEFFAAQAALDATDIESLIENALNYQWREVILLAAGLASKAMCEQLVLGLIERGDKEQDKERRYQLHLIAVACLETAIQLGPEITAELGHRLSQLIPPKNMTDAKALASAGELAVQYLSKNIQLSVSTAITCIRTLAYIGSETALEVLKTYASRSSGRLTIIDELIRTRNSFDKEIYGKSVLSLVFRDKYVPKNIYSLDGFQYFARLKALDLSNCKLIDDLGPLIYLTQALWLT